MPGGATVQLCHGLLESLQAVPRLPLEPAHSVLGQEGDLL